MNGFERFNIRYLSPTMISQWDQAPATLILKRVFGVKGTANANMWRGEAVEAGLQLWLHNRDRQDSVANAKALALETFWDRAQGEVTEETEAAAALVEPMVEQAIMTATDFAAPVIASQLRIEHFIDGVDAPFTGNLDFVFEDGAIIELKTTTRCPSELSKCSLNHRWQAGLYAAARNQPVHLLYVTAKKSACFSVQPNDPVLHTLAQSAKALQKALIECQDGKALLESLPLNVDSFYWDEDTFAAYEQALDGKLRPLSGPGTEDLAAQGIITFGKHAGKHIEDVPERYCDWLLNPQLSNGETFDVPVQLQGAIKEMRSAA